MSNPGRRQTDTTILPGGWVRDDSPWWVQGVLVVLFWLGPSVIVAGVFMAMWAGWIPSPITENGRILVRVESKLDAAVDRMGREVQSSSLKDEQVIRLLLATCRNVSRSDVDRLQCENYWKR